MQNDIKHNPYWISNIYNTSNNNFYTEGLSAFEMFSSIPRVKLLSDFKVLYFKAVEIFGKKILIGGLTGMTTTDHTGDYLGVWGF